jgi:hypothetical protein
MPTDYTQPITLIRLAHPIRLSVVEFAYTPRYMKWTMLKYNPGEGQAASDAWIRYCASDLARGDERFEDITHGATDLAYSDIRKVVGYLTLNGWQVLENRPYTGPSGYYECNAATAAESEDLVLF